MADQMHLVYYVAHPALYKYHTGVPPLVTLHVLLTHHVTPPLNVESDPCFIKNSLMNIFTAYVTIAERYCLAWISSI